MSDQDKKGNKQDQKKKQTAKQKQAAAKTQEQVEKMEKLVADNTEVEITIPWKVIEPVYNKVLQKQAKKVKVKGFRQGKVPLAKAEAKIGLEKLMQLTLQQLLPKYYQEAIKDGDYQPLTQPQFQALSVNKGNDWVVKAIFAQKPNIKLKGYKKIVKKAKKKAEETIKEEEKAIKEKQAEAKKDKKKDKKKKADKDQEQPKEMTQQQKDDIKVQTIFSQLVKEIEPEVPEILIRQNTQRELQKIANQLKQMKMELGDYLKAQNMTKQQLTSRLALSSLNQLQVEFLLGAIAEKENISASQEDVDKKIDEVEDEKMKERMKKDKGYQDYLKGMQLKQKVIKHLLEI